MPIAEAQAKPVKEVAILCLDDALPTTVAGPMDVFNHAGQLWNQLCHQNPTPFFHVRLVSPGGQPVVCMGGVQIQPQAVMEEAGGLDLVIVAAAGIAALDEAAARVTPWLKDQHARGAMIASVCTGAFAVAATGLLDGRKATTHWGFVELFRARYPKVDLRPECLLTEDGNLYCSGGVNAYAELCLYLVEKFCGYTVARQCARSLVLDGDRPSQSPYSIFEFQKKHGDAQVLKAQNLIERQAVGRVDFGEIAKTVAMSERNFKRRFKEATGNTPIEYLQRYRVERAKELLENTLQPVERVAADVGYEDAAFFREVFRRHAGLTPHEYRGKFKVSLF